MIWQKTFQKKTMIGDKMETNQIIKGDCIEQMKQLPDNSVDAIEGFERVEPIQEIILLGKKGGIRRIQIKEQSA